MPPHFSNDEYAARVAAAQERMRARGLDGVLLFAPESHYYLSGYDTFGFALFQCMVLPAEGALQLLTRAPDLRQARLSSNVADARIHIWRDDEDADPYAQLLELLARMQLRKKVVGIETDTHGLTAHNGRRVFAALENEVELVEASDLISELRRRKSAREIECHRRAAALADDAFDAAMQTTHGGAFEGDILAAMQGAVFKGGGDYAGNEFIIGSGEAALLCRYQSGRRHLSARDQLTLEWAGAYRRYHAAMMRTLITGAANARQKRMHAAALEALLACEEEIRPGAPMGNVFDAHARVLDAHGFAHARLNACGYGMGARFHPMWMDMPMFYRGNPLPMETGNVFFLHMILMDSEAGLAMCLGHSVLLGENGIERLSQRGLELAECDAG